MKSKSEKELLEGEIALQKAAMRTVRTLLEGERVGHNWPDIFITGNIPADASDDLLGAYALWAWGNAQAGASIPPHFGDVMARIANRLNISGTPQSFLNWSKERKEASK